MEEQSRDVEVRVNQEQEENQHLQEIDEQKPLFSNKTQRVILLILDIVGLAIFLVYCFYIQSYISTLYFLMFLILIHVTWETEFYKFGMYEKKDSDKKIFKDPLDFQLNFSSIREQYKSRKTVARPTTKTFDDDIASEESYLEETEIQYKPLYWVLCKDQKKLLWLFLLVYSALTLIMKGVFLGIIKNDPQKALTLMTPQNYEGIEIYFTLTNNKFIFNAKDYVKIFLPNSLILIFCGLVMLLRRVNTKKYLEQFNDVVSQQIFSFYFVIVWAFLALILITSQSLIGYFLFIMQCIVGQRLFQREDSIWKFDQFVVQMLKYVLYVVLIFVYFAGTPYIIQFVSDTSYWPQFFGLDIMFEMRNNRKWSSYVFLASGLLLFTFLCIVSEQLRNEKRKQTYKDAIRDCIEHYEIYQFRKQKQQTMTVMEQKDKKEIEQKEEEIQFNPLIAEENELKNISPNQPARMSHVEEGDAEDRNKFLFKLNQTLFSLSDKFTKFIDQPIVTLRVLQLLMIAILIMQQTYESLLGVIWVMITGFTLRYEINQFTSLVLAIPSVFVNFLIFYYQCIPNMNLPDNPYVICSSADNVCRKLGFFPLDREYKEIINLFIMDVSIFAFFLYLRQVQKYHFQKISLVQTLKNEVLKSKKEQKKEISWWTLIFATSLKASYVVSLVIVYWIGFFDVNLIQLILVLFLLIFIINDSTLCIYKQLNEKTGELQEYVVPFSFRYWVVFLVYICIITFLRYIYILFFMNTQIINSDQQWIISLIGINNQENYDILFWVLFYFAALQYDSYRSKIYLRYSNQIVEIFLSKISNKEKQVQIKTSIQTLYLLFMKTIIWITFTLNICFIIFTPFSFVNLGLFVFIGGFFVHYTIQFTRDRVNYHNMARCWYIYLITLYVAFIIRYIFQFICLPNYQQVQDSNFANLYNNLQSKYQQYGFYQYNQSRLRLEYLPDMIAIFFGAVSLNTYRFFADQQKQQINQPHTQSQLNNTIDKPLLSQDSLMDQSGQSDAQNTDKLEQKRKEEMKQLLKIMQINILDQYPFLKKPIIFIAQINTDILTLYVVFSVVFFVQSVASFIILILYLSYFVTVHNALLDNVEKTNLLARLKQKIIILKKQYVDYNQKFEAQANTAEEIDLVKATSTIALTRMKIRIEKKVSIWKISFSFSCICVFLTYLSIYLSLVITSKEQKAILDTQLALFIFGTFAQETNISNCFCGKSDLSGCVNNVSEFSSTIFNEVIFYLILVFANVVDAGCTMFLKDQLEKEQLSLQKFENKFAAQKEISQSRDVISKSMIQNLQGFSNEVEGVNQAEENPITLEDQKEIEVFLQKFPFLTIKYLQNYQQPQQLSKLDLEKIKTAALDINFYNNRSRVFNLNLTTAGFVTLQRLFILILLFNTLLANNIFSLVYLGMATYLFMQRTGASNVRILNTFSVVAIWIQYIMIYFLNYEIMGENSMMPFYAQDYSTDFFSVIKLAKVFQDYPYFIPYLGFDNGDIMDCSLLTPTNSTVPGYIPENYCVSNQEIEWIFILNTLVLSLIYLYFLLLQYLSKKILSTTIKMELDLQQTQSVLQKLYSNHSIEIHLNYQNWKNRVYSTLSGIVSQIIKINHIIFASIIILLANSNRILLNYFEFMLAIGFLIIFELVLVTNRKENLMREKTYFKVLFYFASFTISMYTILRLPWILNWCAQKSEAIVDENDFQDGFICLEIFEMKLGGMIFIMFFIALHFDLIDSEQFTEALNRYMIAQQLQAKMVSKALAYHKNFKKYKAILQVQEQKAIFNLIQYRAQEKLKTWHAKLLDKTSSKTDLAMSEKNEQEESKLVEKEEQIQEIKEEIREERKSIEKEKSELKEDGPVLSKSQKVCISIITWIQKYNNKFKFMGMPNIMDYLLSQNIMLKRKIQLPLIDFLQENYYKFEQELLFLDNFYNYLHRSLKRQPTQIIDIQNITEEVFQKLEKSQITNSKNWKKLQKGISLLKLNSRVMQQQQMVQSQISISPLKSQQSQQYDPEVTYEKYVQAPDLQFVEIVDDKQLIFVNNTKYSSALTKHSLGVLIFRICTEIFGLMITYWMPFCFLLIIFYYTVNSGLLGAVLPFMLFIWILIDEKVQSKVFWIISFTIFFFITLIVFAYSLSGVEEKQSIQTGSQFVTPWYYPLYDGTQNISYEIMLMIFIIFQVNFAKTYGVYQKSLQDIENIFQGYIRMKFNKFSNYIKKQIINEYNLSKKNDDLPTTTEELEHQLKEIEKESLVEQEVIDSERQFQLTERIEIERRIIEDPKLLLEEKSTMFERIFSYKYSRPGVDLYPITASIQILILIYTLIFFTNMVNESVKINNILKTNQIPTSLIWALLVEFFFMFFERYVTMKDNVEIKGVEDKKKGFFQKYKSQFLLKFGLQICTVILIYWLVFFKIGNPWRSNGIYDPETQTASSYSNYKVNNYIVCFFILYSAYFTVSAIQLRFGYKKLKLRNTLLQSYNQVSALIAQTYYAIPFLFELKVLMDWTFLETSLDVFQWFRLEDIQGIMYFTKNQSNGYLTRPLGQKVSGFMKCTMGCSLVLFIFLCIFGPLILFSSLNPASELNPVTGGEFSLSIINLKTSLNVVLYQTNQFYGLENTLNDQGEIDDALNQKCTNSIINNAPKSGELQEFQLLNFSNRNWDISYPLFTQLNQQIAEKLAGTVDHEFFFNVTYVFTRDQQKIIPNKNSFQYPGSQLLNTLPGQNQSSLNITLLEQIQQLLNCANIVPPPKPVPDPNPDPPLPPPLQVQLPNFYIETMQLYSADGSSFKPKPIYQNGVNSVSGANISFFCSSKYALDGQSWWTLVYTGDSKLLDYPSDLKEEDRPNGLIMFVVSDTYSPLTYGFSIITIYTSVILLIGSFIRSLFSGQIWLLEYKGMVYPDDLLMICQAISIARSQKDYKRENMLYFELIDILRSPEIVKIMTGTWTHELKVKEEEREKLKLEEEAEAARAVQTGEKLKQD